MYNIRIKNLPESPQVIAGASLLLCTLPKAPEPTWEAVLSDSEFLFTFFTLSFSLNIHTKGGLSPGFVATPI